MAQAANKSSFGSLQNDAYKRFIRLLVHRRDASGLKQQQVADKLGWNQSVIAKIECVERRVDFVEFVLIANAVGYDAAALVPEVRAILEEEGYLSPGCNTGKMDQG
jgi:transcriptional regulator with XRE-family HTH domain